MHSGTLEHPQVPAQMHPKRTIVAAALAGVLGMEIANCVVLSVDGYPLKGCGLWAHLAPLGGNVKSSK